MDHHDLTARLVRRVLTPGEDEAIRSLNRKQAQDILRDRVARGAFEGAMMELAGKSNSPRRFRDVQEVVEEIESALVDEVRHLAVRLMEMSLHDMNRPQVSGKQTYTNGWERGSTHTWYEIEYPKSVSFTRGYRSSLSIFIKNFRTARFMKQHAFAPQDMVQFFKHSAVKQWLDKQWPEAVQDHLDPRHITLNAYSIAEEAVYDNADVNVETTEYLESGEERAVESPMLKWSFYMGDPKIDVLKTTFDGREFALRLNVFWEVGSVTKVEKG